jgi:hypothetical protein
MLGEAREARKAIRFGILVRCVVTIRLLRVLA